MWEILSQLEVLDEFELCTFIANRNGRRFHQSLVVPKVGTCCRSTCSAMCTFEHQISKSALCFLASVQKFNSLLFEPFILKNYGVNFSKALNSYLTTKKIFLRYFKFAHSKWFFFQISLSTFFITSSQKVLNLINLVFCSDLFRDFRDFSPDSIRADQFIKLVQRILCRS